MSYSCENPMIQELSKTSQSKYTHPLSLTAACVVFVLDLSLDFISSIFFITFNSYLPNNSVNLSCTRIFVLLSPRLSNSPEIPFLQLCIT